MMQILAEEFTQAGNQVLVVTETPGSTDQDRAYDVMRAPRRRELITALRRSDVCLSANVSLRGLAPMLLGGVPIVISHQGTYGPRGKLDPISLLKNSVTRFTTNICCSQAVQASIPGPSIVIPNTYDDETFRPRNDVVRDRDIVFVGRLVSDKGVKDLISAFECLGSGGFRPNLTIVGDGPERPALVSQIETSGLASQVALVGIKRGHELAALLGRHRVIAVPSRWAEPFGIVALEGIACGCVAVGTNLGGLPEAIGPCGVTVENGNVPQMAAALESLLTNDTIVQKCKANSAQHLAYHARSSVAKRYLEVLHSATF
jgi:glycogen(starch) synthase